MQSVSYAATRWGYAVQVIESGQIVYEYSGGNCWKESTTTIDPGLGHTVPLYRLKVWARQTASEIARERGIAPVHVWHDPDLEAQLQEENAQR